MQILVISGFLGAGKTTFIKELVKRTDDHPVIMENEYGDNNIDSLDLKQNTAQEDDIKIMEFMEGCVCCTMKDSFVNSVLAIYSSLSPEYLIIEPTGVGRLSNILNNLKPILNKAISLLRPIVVLSPDNYYQNMKKWPELYKDQIENAQIVVFSKCENTPSEVLEAITKEVNSINPKAQVVPMHYSKMDSMWWDQLLTIEDKDEAASEDAESSNGNDSKEKNFSNSPLKEAEDFSQVSIEVGGLHNQAELIQFLEDCLRGEFGNVARAKGNLWVDNEFVRFDLADRMYVVSGSPENKCQCVVIGQHLDEKKIRKRLGRPNYSFI